MSTDTDVDPAPPESVSSPARSAALKAARSGEPLSATQLRLILNIEKSAFFRNQKRGVYDCFRMKADLGAYARYSGLLVTRWLNGEAIYTPVFAGRRK